MRNRPRLLELFLLGTKSDVAIKRKYMSDALGILEKAREELDKQLFSLAESLSKGFQWTKTFEDIEQITKIRAAIEALDKAIAAKASRTHQARHRDQQISRAEIERGALEGFETPRHQGQPHSAT